MRVTTRIAIAAFVVSIGSGVCLAGPQVVPTPGGPFAALSESFAAIAERVAPSVVQIFTAGYGVGGGAALLTKQQGTGSGIILSSDGYIVTNAHVVSRARRIQVLLADRFVGKGAKRTVLKPRVSKLDATLVGLDSATDLALLKIAQNGLPSLALADSDAVRQGQLVLAFGSPLGLGNTVTMGVVSAVARQLHVDDPLVYIQTDAPINPGNSGGPLVDAAGRVVGINTMILSQSGGSEGVGLAIPSNTVRSIVAQLRSHGHVHRGAIGVQVQTVTPTMVAAMGLPVADGVIVADVDPTGPGATAGLQIGDVVLAVDQHPVANVRQFALSLFRHDVDATVVLDVRRGQERTTIRSLVIERPDDPSRFLEMVRPETNLVPQLDLLGVDLDSSVVASLPPLRITTGVLVAAISAAAAPSGDRFQPGDVIHAVNGAPVASLLALRQAVKDMNDGDPIVLQVERAGSLHYVAFELD
jgi:serine protease Do